MELKSMMGAALVLASGALLLSAPVSAQTAAGSAKAKAPPSESVEMKPAAGANFAAPVRLMAGDKFLGEARLYPSPVMHDMNGDGLADIVVGDLFGRVTVALRVKGDGPAKFGAEAPLNDFEGKELKFKNW